MAKYDWAALAAEFLQAHNDTGITAIAWCEQQGINYQSARRYLKTRGQSPTPPDFSRIAARHRQPTPRKTAQTAQTAQPDASAQTAQTAQIEPEPELEPIEQRANRQSDGRFGVGNRAAVGAAGNPDPNHATRFQRKHGGYAQYLDADELFESAGDLRLWDELIFTRARVLSVTRTLKALQADLALASEMTDRIALYDKILKAETALDKNVARVESLERTLSALRIDDVTAPKIVADTKRITAATRKLTAEADRLEKEGGTETTPMAEMVAELQNMGTGGLMS